MTQSHEERLRNLPFIDFLKAIKDDLKNLRYRKDSHEAYWDANKIASLFTTRYVNQYNLDWGDQYLTQPAKNIKSDIELLERYDMNSRTYKAKEDAISEFRDEFLTDLDSLIRELERNA